MVGVCCPCMLLRSFLTCFFFFFKFLVKEWNDLQLKEMLGETLQQQKCSGFLLKTDPAAVSFSVLTWHSCEFIQASVLGSKNANSYVVLDSHILQILPPSLPPSMLCGREWNKSIDDVWIRWRESRIDPIMWLHSLTHTPYSSDFCCLANRNAEDLRLHVKPQLCCSLRHRNYYYLHHSHKNMQCDFCILCM